MKKITVSLLTPPPKQDYTIYVSAGAIGEIASLYDFSGYSKVFIVTDDTVGHLFLEKLKAALPVKPASTVLPAGEQQKSLDNIEKIWTAMHAAGCDRKSLVINLGGGLVSDMGGFAAATYMRGVDFLNLPTTLLAQVDASVGGKTGFNFDGIKNLVGTFDQPAAVIIDTQTLEELPEREFLSGFAEIIKHGLVADKAYFEAVAAKPPLEFTPPELEEIIALSCAIKSGVVRADAGEQGSRRLINFGHTVGHAIESLSLETGKPLLHGEAVSIGMVAEAGISKSLGKLSGDEFRRITAVLRAAGLPVAVSGLAVDDILAKMQSDKKNEYGGVNFTLLDGIGRALYNQAAGRPVVIEALQLVIREKP